MHVKDSLNRAGITYEAINIDNDEAAKQYVLDNGFMTAPVMEHEGKLIGDVKEMIELISDIQQ